MSFDRVQWNYPADIAEPLAVDCDRRANQNNLSGIIKKNAKLDFSHQYVCYIMTARNTRSVRRFCFNRKGHRLRRSLDQRANKIGLFEPAARFSTIQREQHRCP